jgi:hypothetical protein
MLSREGVPVDVVGRPSMGEGRTPGIDGVGEDASRFERVSGASGPTEARESAMLRLRNAILGCTW